MPSAPSPVPRPGPHCPAPCPALAPLPPLGPLQAGSEVGRQRLGQAARHFVPRPPQTRPLRPPRAGKPGPCRPDVPSAGKSRAGDGLEPARRLSPGGSGTAEPGSRLPPPDPGQPEKGSVAGVRGRPGSPQAAFKRGDPRIRTLAPFHGTPQAGYSRAGAGNASPAPASCPPPEPTRRLPGPGAAAAAAAAAPSAARVSAEAAAPPAPPASCPARPGTCPGRANRAPPCARARAPSSPPPAASSASSSASRSASSPLRPPRASPGTWQRRRRPRPHAGAWRGCRGGAASLSAQGLRGAERAAPTPSARLPGPGSRGCSRCLLRASCGWGCREPRRALGPLPSPPPLNIHRFLPPRPARRLPSSAAPRRRPPLPPPPPSRPRLSSRGQRKRPRLTRPSAQPSHIPGTSSPGPGSVALAPRAGTLQDGLPFSHPVHGAGFG